LKLHQIFFSESIWINLGENFRNMNVHVFDMRGRLVAIEDSPEAATFKINMHNLMAGMYFFVIIRNNEVLTILKSVKK
jgi:hypothetical protein